MINGTDQTNDQSIKIDCSDIIEQVISRTSEKQDADIQKLVKNMESQRDDMSNMMRAITGLTTAMTKNMNEGSHVRHDSDTRSSHASTDSNVHNVPQGTRTNDGSNGLEGPQPKEGLNGPKGPRPNDGISVVASNIWFGGEKGSAHDPTASQHSKAASETCHDQEQEYWQETLQDYGENVVFGKEISSSIASASKIFWEKPMKEEVSKKKLEMETAKIPANCTFLTTKRTNPEVWTAISGFHRTSDSKIQDIQTLFASSISLTLRAASTISSLSKSDENNAQIMESLSLLKDSLSIAGKVNQSINQYRRVAIKPSLPPQYSKLADIVDDSATFLFGESISDKVENLEKENKIKNLLKEKYPKNNERKRSYGESSSSNYRSSSKTLKRTHYNPGQNYKKPNNEKYHQNNNQNNHHTNQNNYQTKDPKKNYHRKPKFNQNRR